MRLNDAVTGALLLVLSFVLIAYARTFPSLPGQAYGPGLFPILIGLCLALCGLGLVRKGISERRQIPLARLLDWAYAPRLAISVALTIGMVVFYIYCVDWLGFIPTAFISLAILFLWLRGRAPSSLALAGTVAVATYLAFHDLLLVPLPAGLLEPFIW